MAHRASLAFVLLTLALTACAPGGAATSGPAGGPSRAAAPQKTLVYISRGEPPTLAVKPLVGFSGSLNPQIRLFNAMLDYIDESEATHPYLAELLPQLNTDTWRVSAEGSMETIWKLRPNLTWHDGTPFTANDLVFGWEVFSKPALGVSNSLPFGVIDSATAPDDRTFVIRWKKPYPNAASMDTKFQGLPRHILQTSLHELDPAAFITLPFWTAEYVGLGAYRVDHWEPGAFIEASAFDGHALGRARISRLKLAFIPDENTAVANMLSGEAQFVSDFVITADEGQTLEQAWAANNGGTVYYAQVLFRVSQIQLRPDYAKPKALLDVRVRRALAQSFDTPGVIAGLTGGRGLLTYTLSSPKAPYYPLIDRAITKNVFDPRAAQALFEEAGLTKGADGFYQGPGGEPFQLVVWTTGGAYEQENRVFVDGLRRTGIDATPQTLGLALLNDPEARAHSPGVFTGGAGSDRYTDYSTRSIPSAENHWVGNNRGGWDNSDYERFYQGFNSALDRDERVQQLAQMEKTLTEEVGSIPHYFTLVITAFSSDLQGPLMRQTPDAVTGQSNVYTWEWKN